MRIPQTNKDLRRYVLRRDLGKLALYLLWTVAWGTGAVAYNLNHTTYPPERLLLGWRLVLWMAVGLGIGFFLFRIHRMLADRSVSGVLTESGLSRGYATSSDPGGLKAVTYDFRLYKVLRLRLANGRRKRIRIEEKQGSYLYYREGDRLVSFHGLPYPINADATGEQGWLCAACGRVHPSKLDACDQCGFSLIDPKELTP